MKTLAVFLVAALALALGTPVRDNPEEGEFFEGDIMNEDYRKLFGKNGLIDERYRWIYNDALDQFEIPYIIDQSNPPTQTIQDEFEQAVIDYGVETNFCVMWVPWTGEGDYVRVTDGSGCSSYVGRIGGEQEIHYASGCSRYGTVQHEMYHALGFHHEQSRSERDDYVIINWENIESGHEHNFDKYDEDEVTAFGVPYDYLSVMHYSRTSFSENGQDTITTIDPAYQDEIGQRVYLSDSDIAKLNQMYQCQRNKHLR